MNHFRGWIATDIHDDNVSDCRSRMRHGTYLDRVFNDELEFKYITSVIEVNEESEYYVFTVFMAFPSLR